MTRVVLHGGRLATMETQKGRYGLLEDGALCIEDGTIAWIGANADLPDLWRDAERKDLGGQLVTPALVDCHTHLVYGGQRAVEFEQRLTGVSYEEISRRGGGILSTVRATRALDVHALVEAALPRLDALLAEGVGTLEIKSGYGLTVESELDILRAARELGHRRPVRIKTTYLAAHALPPEYCNQADLYIQEVVLPGMRQARDEGLADAVDVFCEGIGFSLAQTERVFDAADALTLPVKIHAEQLSNLGGTEAAAARGALSCDHLEYLDEAGVEAMARANSIAVLLPGAFYTLRESRLPPVNLLRKHGVAIALATDCNPGSSPMTSLLLALNMGCTLFRITPEEALAGVTREAARALGLDHEIGTLEVGKRAELAIWDVEHPAELAYRIGANPLSQRFIAPFETPQ